jgi:molecular chaperone GrpE
VTKANEEAMDDEKMNSQEPVQIDQEEWERLKAKENEAGKLLDQVKRIQADYENSRKRLAREKDEFLQYANEGLIAQFLPIVDNFDRALLHADTTPEAHALLEGIRLIQKQLEDVLKQNGLTRVESVGKTFDPHRHEAMAQVATQDHPDNTVVEEVQRGWMYRERLLRPALVKVATSNDNKEA